MDAAASLPGSPVVTVPIVKVGVSPASPEGPVGPVGPLFKSSNKNSQTLSR